MRERKTEKVREREREGWETEGVLKQVGGTLVQVSSDDLFLLSQKGRFW